MALFQNITKKKKCGGSILFGYSVNTYGLNKRPIKGLM